MMKSSLQASILSVEDQFVAIICKGQGAPVRTSHSPMAAERKSDIQCDESRVGGHESIVYICNSRCSFIASCAFS